MILPNIKQEKLGSTLVLNRIDKQIAGNGLFRLLHNEFALFVQVFQVSIFCVRVFGLQLSPCTSCSQYESSL